MGSWRHVIGHKKILAGTLGAIVLLSCFLVFKTHASEQSSWSAPRPSAEKEFNEIVQSVYYDSSAAVGLGVDIGKYHQDPLLGDFLTLKVSTSANSRKGIQYLWTQPWTYYWYDVYEQTGISQDDSCINLTLPFPVLFYGVEYTSVWVCSNGFLSFDSQSTDPTPDGIPCNCTPNSLIAPFWRDLKPDPSLGRNITYGTIAGTPSVFVVSWNVTSKSNSALQSFQVVIKGRMPGCGDYHNSIYFQYKSITTDCLTSVGVEDQTGNKGSAFSSASLHNSLCLWCDSGGQGCRLQRIKIALFKTDVYAAALIDRTNISGYNMEIESPGNPSGNVYLDAFTAVSGSLAKYAAGIICKIATGYSLLIVPEIAFLLIGELDKPTSYPQDAGPDQNEASVTAYCHDESWVNSNPYDSTLAVIFLWKMLDSENVDHFLTISAELVYADLDHQRSYTISTSVTLRMYIPHQLTVNTFKTTGSQISGVKVWINGVQYCSPVTLNVSEGFYTVEVESSFFRRQWWLYTFDHWEGDSYDNTTFMYINSDTILRAYYVEDYLCPTLFVWSGTDFAYEALLNIHAESDVTLQHEIQQTLVPQTFLYRLQLQELDNFTSHIDQVKLYAIDTDGQWHTCPLVLARHGDDYVTLKLLFDDDRRVDLAPTETIDLKFLQPIPYSQTSRFVFEINGHNRKTET